jgi:hypothetical protein
VIGVNSVSFSTGLAIRKEMPKMLQILTDSAHFPLVMDREYYWIDSEPDNPEAGLFVRYLKKVIQKLDPGEVLPKPYDEIFNIFMAKAIMLNDTRMIQLLAGCPAYGAVVDAAVGSSAITWAILHGSVELVQTMLQYEGYDPFTDYTAIRTIAGSTDAPTEAQLHKLQILLDHYMVTHDNVMDLSILRPLVGPHMDDRVRVLWEPYIRWNPLRSAWVGALTRAAAVNAGAGVGAGASAGRRPTQRRKYW